MTSRYEQPLDNIYEGLSRAEIVLRRDVEREERPDIRADLEDVLECVCKARKSHSFLAGDLP
ncbi:hypothetical protein B0W47_00540 [Komagataeibacter nataicola]|uniref:Uncharacterized protein n=1 Tax=Komagataeibacter nataicola TaxID=265960 RepID=A0A9N7H0J4_9PROT|nr:hypothetical protein [Komagataeibacter nataicola]AQU86190.1 hypothetical protein B0W47_00540 [Komagataeibacter nataicola]PYD65325.1 hypothetical protein CDI09_14045 [Komagataeibacter nataicola]WNM08407.1 hypothetical protein RI056_16340 [Komagataeibacter nataicola]GBR23002.1 hypothetical protein AA0616_2417 [Komagataeibacter nataicola NRIC 0616]